MFFFLSISYSFYIHTMSIGGYKIRNKQEIHFISFAVVEWIDVFTRQVYKEIIIESLNYCQREKGLILHGWCIMSNHLHLLASARNDNLSDILRDFKKFTSKRIIHSIRDNERESRKDWMLNIFIKQGASNSRNSEYQFWRQDNQLKECYSPKFTIQKLNYIHNNPVKAGIVEKPEHYLYSSAQAYCNKEQKGKLEISYL